MKHNNHWKILIANEDTNAIESMREIFIKERDIVVLTTRSADMAVELAGRKKPDVIISDTKLLDLSGWELLDILKKNDMTRSLPFIMIGNNGASGKEDEVRALSLGAVDYINKPFIPEVLCARVKSILMRYLTKTDQIESEEILKSGNISVNLSTHTAYVKGKPIDLTPKEFALLCLFIRRQNRVLNRVFLSEIIWEREYFNTSKTIDRHIANLRKKLGKEGKRIETLPTIGYKFNGINSSN